MQELTRGIIYALKEMDDPYKENNRYVPNNGRSPS
jgi:hypothetical protein